MEFGVICCLVGSRYLFLESTDKLAGMDGESGKGGPGIGTGTDTAISTTNATNTEVDSPNCTQKVRMVNHIRGSR